MTMTTARDALRESWYAAVNSIILAAAAAGIVTVLMGATR